MQQASAPDQPMAGLRVLDFTRVLAGPYCTALLVDLGADVLKVEPPGGDDYRHIGPFYADGSSAPFHAVNRGKRSIVLDLSSESHRAIAVRLAADADVLVENFRPGVADKLGIGWSAASAANPRLIYASISGFGQTGPNAHRPAYDIIVQALSGIMSVTGEPDGAPTLIGESVADVVSGLFCSWAILAALHQRSRTGRGTRIDVAMLDSMLAMQPLVTARYLATGQAPRRVGNRHPLSAPFGAFRARDGQFVLAVLNTKLFEALARTIARPELANDPRFASDPERLRHESALREAIEGWAADRTAAGAVATLVAAGIPAAVVGNIADALASEQVAERPALQSVADPSLNSLLVPEQPARFSGVARGGLAAAPALGADNERVLANPEDAWSSRS